ncbi:SPRY domain containing protein [Entamoeba histolytica HM-1:IMSS-B]|uniref:B30.2/SPRY domain-containing protein n=6 Tax=Entamoeba histolytica TaxID=5759 RepID=C4MBL8_ENTH1|nr:uncharacterized protein EHI_116470 [Entamoeba histolytica HM-1:IMSS]EMD43443.1 SPRY domain containing protein [Entamoeba histolytica KU27]EMH75295.1 SPRY domain containing protein [Entamoeba histolytica HM-1:IMSS-B]EMS16954.1 SPRY domain containing protein [Entamoeba histolytica HM-3:IMSS]ENY64465.1 SPRY domain containing protein [Entamoeba histolytica HM-1:IMSS-A]GAT99433.1 hypothetical protein conserved domain containing [Entamoeba histolytica]|eukprot:XP_648245.1 uncharacterized protein EHI_116470 [Entamoeba histolytica HM-1:IMSS]
MESKQLPIQIIIREGLLTQILQYLPIDDVVNFSEAYPRLNSDYFASYLFCKQHKLSGSISKHLSLRNRSWKTLCSLKVELNTDNKFIPNVHSNRFGLSIEDNVIINTNTTNDRRNTIIAKNPFSLENRWFTFPTLLHQYTILQTPIFYYEVTILPTPSTHEVEEFVVSIGLVSERTYPEDRQVGWEDGGIGVHSDDGKLFNQNGTGVNFTEPFNSGETLGVGFIPRSYQVFFTKNGKKIKNSITVKYQKMYPAMGFSTAYAVEVNFGHKPFIFDLLEEIDKI